MKGLTFSILLLLASSTNAALIQFDVVGNDARSWGDPPLFEDRADYTIDVTCPEDLSECTLEFNVPNKPPEVNLPSVVVTQNDLMHASGTLGFTSSDFQTQVRLLGDAALLPVLNADNFDQAVLAFDWRFYDGLLWPNFTGWYGGTSTDISTPVVITVPEPSLGSLMWLPFMLGIAICRRLRRG